MHLPALPKPAERLPPIPAAAQVAAAAAKAQKRQREGRDDDASDGFACQLLVQTLRDVRFDLVDSEQ